MKNLLIAYYFSLCIGGNGLILSSRNTAIDAFILSDSTDLNYENDTISLSSYLDDFDTKYINGGDQIEEAVITAIPSFYFQSLTTNNHTTLLYRGNSAVQNQITWNGITLNSAFYGQADGNLLPIYFTDKINSNSSPLQQGGLQLDLYSGDNDLYNHRIIAVSNSMNNHSLNYKYNGLVKIGLYTNYEDNRFRYANVLANNDSQIIQQNNNVAELAGYVEKKWNIGKGANMHWSTIYIQTHREIPPLSIAITSEDQQADNRVGTSLIWSKEQDNLRFSQTISSVFHRIKYNSDISNGFYNNYKAQLDIDKRNGNYQIVFDFPINVGKTPYYNTLKQQILPSITATGTKNCPIGNIIHRINPTVKIGLSHKQQILPTAGLNYELEINSYGTIKVYNEYYNRIPTLNDLYWFPLGNPALEVEKGIHSELSYEYNNKYLMPSIPHIKLNCFMYITKGLIRWVPESNTNLYRPINVGRSRRIGGELLVSYHRKINSGWILKYNHNLSYLYSEEYDTGENSYQRNQYYPSVICNNRLDLIRKKLSGSLNYRYEARRAFFNVFTPPVHLANLEVAYTIIRKDKQKLKKINLSMIVQNCLNRRIEYMPNRPQPPLNITFKTEIIL